MPRVTTAFVAEDVRDEGRGRYIAVGLYAGDVEFASIEDAKLDRFVVFTVISDLDVGPHTLSIQARSGSAGVLQIGGGSFVIDEENTSFISIARIRGLYFPKPGDYVIEISIDDKKISDIEFGIVILGEHPAPSPEAETS